MTKLTDEELVREISTGCYLNGIVRKNAQQNIVAIPITAGPSEFPSDSFREAVQTMPDFNILVDKLASSTQFLQLVREELGGSDEFMNSLFQVYDETNASEYKCKLIAGLNRNDFLFDRNAKQLFQVEMNTLSCSFNAMAQRVSELFQHFYSESTIPQNKSFQGTVEFIQLVTEQYGMCYGKKNVRLVLMIVQANENNIFDQKFIEHDLIKRGIRVVRKTFDELHDGLIVDQKDGALLYNSEPVAAVYYRVGYVPDDYKSPKDWQIRSLIEASSAVKIPNVQYQIIGKKIVQMLLKQETVFNKFVPKNQAALCKFFTGLYPTQDEAVVARVMKNPELFVLKPQRDGGGHNLFGKDIVDELRSPTFHKKAYILMDMIDSLRGTNTLIKSPTEITVNAKCISELGIYGGFLKIILQGGDQKEAILFNEPLGYLLRTKEEHSRESGVAAGFGYLDAPKLVE